MCKREKVSLSEKVYLFVLNIVYIKYIHLHIFMTPIYIYAIAAILLCDEMPRDPLTCINLGKCAVKYIGEYFNYFRD